MRIKCINSLCLRIIYIKNKLMSTDQVIVLIQDFFQRGNFVRILIKERLSNPQLIIMICSEIGEK